METVREIATSVSVAAVIIGSVYIICPNGTMSRHMKYIIGIIMLIATVTPFFGASIDIDIETASHSYTADATVMLSAQAEYIAGSLLENASVEYERIEVNTDISDGGDISISSVYVYGASDPEKAGELISQNLGVQEVEIIND